VLFSGQALLPPLVQHAATYTVGALLLLLACKGLAYGILVTASSGRSMSTPYSNLAPARN
jgi:hypothetical protein